MVIRNRRNSRKGTRRTQKASLEKDAALEGRKCQLRANDSEQEAFLRKEGSALSQRGSRQGAAENSTGKPCFQSRPKTRGSRKDASASASTNRPASTKKKSNRWMSIGYACQALEVCNERVRSVGKTTCSSSGRGKKVRSGIFLDNETKNSYQTAVPKRNVKVSWGVEKHYL